MRKLLRALKFGPAYFVAGFKRVYWTQDCENKNGGHTMVTIRPTGHEYDYCTKGEHKKEWGF